jgi:hypothetical protein
MKDTEPRGPGRPKKFEALERIQVLVLHEQHEAAKGEAAKRGISISEVYRDWIDKGRKRK